MNLTQGESQMNKIISAVCAVLFVLILGGAYLVLRAKYVSQPAHKTAVDAPREAQVQVFEDEIFLNKNRAVVGGTIRNISAQTLSSITVALELKNATDSEMRNVLIEPSVLAPQAEGRYTLQLPAKQWSAARVSAVTSGDAVALNFKSSLGKPRPFETPQTQSRTVLVERPRTKGDDFINTPDTPISIR